MTFNVFSGTFNPTQSINLLSSSIFFSSPVLSRRRLDVYHTSTSGVALVCEFRMQVWNVLHAARWKYRMQKIDKKSPSGRHRTTLSGYTFATRHVSTIGKKLVKQQYLLHMFPQYGELGPLAADPVVWGIPANFTGFRVLAALLHGTPVVGVSQTLRRWTEGATYIR